MLSKSVHDDAAFARLIQWVPAVLLTLMVAGAWLLIMLPGLVAPGPALRGSDALFTMTSAVCGAGLTVVNLATRLTPAGQALIAAAMELGALVYVIVGTAVALRIKVRLMGEKQGGGPTWWRLIGNVTGLAVGLQLVAALALLVVWQPEHGAAGGWLPRAGWCLFHAASAFTNSGFSLQTDSLCGYQYHLCAHAVLAPLMVLGGLGYVVLADLWRSVVKRAPLGGFARLALAVTAGAYLLGVVGIGAARLMPYTFAALKLGHETTRPLLMPLNAQTVGGVLADASFLSASARGAGFRVRGTSTPYVPAQVLPPMDAPPEVAQRVMDRLIGPGAHWKRVDRDTLYVDDQLYKAESGDRDLPGEDVTYLLLMAVGGTPGGTMGGINTLAVALLVLAVVAAARGGGALRAGGMLLGEPALRLALALTAGFIGLAALATLLLALVEPFPTMQLMFEAISAVSGAGLSKGLCPLLTAFGRGVIMVGIIAGRVGLLMLMAGAVMGPACAGGIGRQK
jgi:Trk-type K+ transport system membrane component